MPPPQQLRAKTNRYAFATLGRRTAHGVSVAGSLLYADLHRIEAGGWLVENQDSWIVHHGVRKANALAIAFG